MGNSLPPLIPRGVLLGSPKRWQPTISPDGAKLAYLAPDEREILQIWVRTFGRNDDRCVSNARRPVSFYGWRWDSKSIFCFPDTEGDENWHVHAIDLETKNARDLTPWQGVRCYHELTMTSPARPNEMLVALNVRDRTLMDVWRIGVGGAMEHNAELGIMFGCSPNPRFHSTKLSGSGFKSHFFIWKQG
jgi:hypothetical protein